MPLHVLDYNDDGNLIVGTAEHEAIHANGGDDTVFGGLGYDAIQGGDGNDILVGGESLEGDRGDRPVYHDGDWIRGGAGDDAIAAGSHYHYPDYNLDRGLGAPEDTNVGFYFGDEQGGYAYGDGGSSLWGQDGNDTVQGGGGDDTIGGGSGLDRLYGYNGNDTLYGGAGNDTLYGGGNEDLLFGGSGDDYVAGGGGNDTIWGGAGDDTLQPDYSDTSDQYPGDSSDTFAFAPGHGNDLIVHFNPAYDVLDLSDLHLFSSLSEVYAATETVAAIATNWGGSTTDHALLIHTDAGDTIQIQFSDAADITDFHILI